MHVMIGRVGILGEIKFSMNLFEQRLNEANDVKLNPFWLNVYTEYFTDIATMSGTIEDIKYQKMGIDRVVTLRNGKKYLIDEKIRHATWTDILLEYKSASEYDTPGWIEKPLHIDYLAYAFLPSKTCYMFDWPSLQRVWKYYKDKWLSEYKTIRAVNESYTTLSVAVPIDILLEKVSGAKMIKLLN